MRCRGRTGAGHAAEAGVLGPARKPGRSLGDAGQGNDAASDSTVPPAQVLRSRTPAAWPYRLVQTTGTGAWFPSSRCPLRPSVVCVVSELSGVDLAPRTRSEPRLEVIPGPAR
ncbi:hypothetical protein GCM10009864_23490 [Streptomyces lunalinharesii]|uniref:Uncharacterized protein n=1 Tax=Streptomyces lunalinharesii TaxID=333384 RepID=A0ABN3RNF4_9ACTN